MIEQTEQNFNEEVTNINQPTHGHAGGELLENRDMSGFPVSIGTGLALETIFNPIMDVVDESRKFEKLKELNRYDTYIFNVETLIRNILTSVKSEDQLNLKPKDVFEALVDEIDFIEYIFFEHGLTTLFYYNTHQYYKDLYKDRIRKASTPKQLHTLDVTKYCLNQIGNKNPKIKKFDHLVIYDSRMRSLLFSHFPVDLLSYDKFRVLDLLESHTGKIKSREEFNTKYYPVPREDMSFLPFFEYLLVTFGDKVMFKPESVKRRVEVLNSLKRIDVHPMMSEFSMGLKYTFR